MTKIAAIGADELTAGMTILGDSLSATRYGSGSLVNLVNTEDRVTYAIIGTRNVELLASETVYVIADARNLPLI
jgi:isopentenyl diphosphate isomerase/L-lactate dehydrogenase-like FMN-dependent dehydrogenase